MARARRFVEDQGGFGENRLIVRALLAAAGVIDARALPPVPLTYKLLPGHEALLARFFGVNALVPLHTLPPLLRGLRDAGAAPSAFPRPLRDLENGRVVMDGAAQDLAQNEDVKEFYLGISTAGRKSFRDVKHYRRRKRWLA